VLQGPAQGRFPAGEVGSCPRSALGFSQPAASPGALAVPAVPAVLRHPLAPPANPGTSTAGDFLAAIAGGGDF